MNHVLRTGEMGHPQTRKVFQRKRTKQKKGANRIAE
jgi:hypothetical protein